MKDIDDLVNERADEFFRSKGIENPDPEERRLFKVFLKRYLEDDGR